MTVFSQAARDAFAANYPEVPHVLPHALGAHPLLELDALADLAESLPAASIEYNFADLPIGIDGKPAPTGIPSSVRPLTPDDARALRNLPHVTGMTATVWGNSEVNANGRLRRTTVNGVSADILKVYQLKVRTGQFLLSLIHI